MYSSRFKFFLCFIILGIVFVFLVFVVLPKFKNEKNNLEKLAIVDLSKLDSDNDGLSDKQELELKTNPYNWDTNGDGHSDLEEVKTGRNPLKIESYDFVDEDGDGLILKEEIKYKTDPKNSDSDYDGYSDGLEIAAGYDPLKTNLSSLKNLAAKEENNSSQLISKISNVENVLSAKELSDFEKNLREFIGNEASKKELNLANFSEKDFNNSEIKIKKEINKEAVQAYVNALGVLAFRSFPFSILDQQDFQNYLSDLDPNNPKVIENNLKILEDVIVSLKKFEVPNDEEIILWHKKLLALLLNIKNLVDAFQQNRNDLASLISIFKQAQSLTNYATGELYSELQKIVQKYGVNLPLNLDFYKQIVR